VLVVIFPLVVHRAPILSWFLLLSLFPPPPVPFVFLLSVPPMVPVSGPDLLPFPCCVLLLLLVSPLPGLLVVVPRFLSEPDSFVDPLPPLPVVLLLFFSLLLPTRPVPSQLLPLLLPQAPGFPSSVVVFPDPPPPLVPVVSVPGFLLLLRFPYPPVVAFFDGFPPKWTYSSAKNKRFFSFFS
jgi:hypothetical protein